MKLVVKTLTRGGCYTFLIVLGLLLISHAIGVDEYGNHPIVMNIKLYLACTLCGYIVAFAGLIFETKLDQIIKRAIHFLLLLVGTIAVFATSESGSGIVGRKVLIAIFIYVIAYVVIFLLIFGIKKLYALAMKNKPEPDKAKKADVQKEKYTPRFKK